MVYDLERQPVSDASVTLGRTTVLTDLHGRFGFGVVLCGPQELHVTKAKSEPLEWTFQFKSGADVLYLQMTTADQLLEKAARALEKKSWTDFGTFLVRAKSVVPGSLQALVLEASALAQKGRLQEALALVEVAYPPQPVLVLELLLGDLYVATGDKEKADVHWKAALLMREDPELKERLDR